MTKRDLVCEACGITVQLDVTNNNVMMMREPASNPAPGRATIRVGDDVVHQCEDRAFEAPGDVARVVPSE